MSATVHGPGEGERISAGVSSLALKATATETDGPGTFACVPPGTPHTFANRSDAPVRFLNFNTPAGFEDYMRALGAAFADSDGPPDPAAIGAIASRFDFELA